MNYKEFKDKSIDQNCNEALYWLYTKFSTPIAYLLCKTPVTPNQVTVLMAIVGFIGPFFFLNHNYLWIGVILILIARLLDHVDGQIARYKQKYSTKGYFLDWVSSHAMELLVLVTITLGFYQKYDYVLYFGLAGLFGYAMKELLVLRANIIFKQPELKVVKKKITPKIILRKVLLLEYIIEVIPFLVILGHLEWYLIIYGIEYNLLWIIKVIKEWINN